MRYKEIWPVIILGSVAICSAAQMQSEPAPSAVPPTSDQSNINDPGKAGTTYLRGTLPPDQARLMSTIASGVQLKLRRGAVHVVAPSTDIVNQQQSEVVAAMNATSTAPGIHKRTIRAFTNYKFLRSNSSPAATLIGGVPDGENPVSLRQAYGMPQDGGSGVIAIVDAFQYPQADADLQTFSSMFHLPPCRENKSDEHLGCLQKFPQDGAGHEDSAGIPINCGWVGEEALDIEWAHAIAPKARILLVQAKSDSTDDLEAAVKIARTEVISAGGGQVSLSWSASEWQEETSDDSTYATGVLYFAASGDVGGARGYPAASSAVISVGGTGLLRDAAGNLIMEYGWTGSGGGESIYEPLTPFQQTIENIQGSHRNIPDIAADADPNSGAAVYVSTPVNTCVDHPSKDQYQTGWQVIGGTSLATPMVAAMVNVAARHRSSDKDELAAIYANRKSQKRIHDITSMAGTAGGNPIRNGYDNVTGVGAPSGVDFDAN